eukprot:jgi/Chrzof1/10578/Cz05g04050.t1
MLTTQSAGQFPSSHPCHLQDHEIDDDPPDDSTDPSDLDEQNVTQQRNKHKHRSSWLPSLLPTDLFPTYVNGEAHKHDHHSWLPWSSEGNAVHSADKQQENDDKPPEAAHANAASQQQLQQQHAAACQSDQAKPCGQKPSSSNCLEQQETEHHAGIVSNDKPDGLNHQDSDSTWESVDEEGTTERCQGGPQASSSVTDLYAREWYGSADARRSFTKRSNFRRKSSPQTQSGDKDNSWHLPTFKDFSSNLADALPAFNSSKAKKRPFSLRMAEQLLPEGVMSAVSTIQKDMLDTGDALGPAIINYFASAGGGMLVEWVSA